MIFSVTATVCVNDGTTTEMYPVPRFFIDSGMHDAKTIEEVYAVVNHIIDPMGQHEVRSVAYFVDSVDMLDPDERVLVKSYRGACETCATEAHDRLVECEGQRL